MTFTCSTKDQLSLQTFLRSVPIFSNLSEENLNHLIRITAQMRLSEGVYLFEEGSIGRYFFVIEEGEIEICTTSGDKELLLAVRKPGEIIGELSLLDKLPRMASARARTWCNVLIIPREAFDRLILANPSFARDILYTVIPRWRHTESIIRERDQEIYRQSKQLEEALRALKRARDDLEQRVARRTAELEYANLNLRAYIESAEYITRGGDWSPPIPLCPRQTTGDGEGDVMSDKEPAMYEHIILDITERIAWVTMNRPTRRNALSVDHMTELLHCFTTLGQRSDVAVIILRGSGTIFSSGHDLSEMVGQEHAFYHHLFEVCTNLMEQIQTIPQPVIAQVHGAAIAAGCQLVASCDLAIATDDTRFSTPGIKIGLFCSTPMVALSRVVPPKKAMEMLLTGDFISASEALAMGLINRVVPAASLEEETLALAGKILAASALIVGLGKQTFYHQLDMSQHQAYAYAREVMVLNTTFADSQEGISAFLEKRQPRWSER